LVSLLRHLGLWNKAIQFKIIDIIVDSIDRLLIFKNDRFHRFFLRFCDFDAKSLKEPWTINLIIDFTEILFILDHTLKALIMDVMRTVEPSHPLAPSRLAFEALLLRHDLIANDP
jgi:hypothetical protein